MNMPLPRLRWPLALGWQRLLVEHGALLISDTPCEAEPSVFRRLAGLLGPLSQRAEPSHPALQAAFGARQVRALESVPRDRHGQPLLSASAEAFPLHTDEAFLDTPCRWVLLQCWRADPDGGGASWLCDGRAAFEHGNDALRTLMRQPLPIAGLRYPLIDPAGQVRFNPRLSIGADPLEASANSAAQIVPRLLQALAARRFSVLLQPGDLLLLDNARMLHGRSAFGAGSPRLLLRLRLRG